MVSLIHRLPGFIASARRKGPLPPVPPAGAHRYWRIVLKSTFTASRRPTIRRLEWLGCPYSERLKDATFTASSSSGGAQTPTEIATNEILGTAVQDVNNWYTNTGVFSGWLKMDLGEGNAREVGGIVIWPNSAASVIDGSNASFSNPVSWDVEYSDDDSTWALAWSDGHTPWVAWTEYLSLNPNYGGQVLFVEEDNLSFWLDAANSFSDTGSTPAVNNDPVRQITNSGSGANFGQPTLANRPIFKTGGLAGHPYLEFNKATGHFLDDIALAQPTGITSENPFIMSLVSDSPALGSGQVYGVLGVPSSAKAQVIFQYGSNIEIRINKSNWATGTLTSPQALTFQYSTDSELFLKQNTSALQRITGGANQPSAGGDTRQFFRNTVTPDGGYFSGRVYEALIWEVPSGWEIATARRHRYILKKYGFI